MFILFDLLDRVKISILFAFSLIDKVRFRLGFEYFLLFGSTDDDRSVSTVFKTDGQWHCGSLDSSYRHWDWFSLFSRDVEPRKIERFSSTIKQKRSFF